MSAAEVPRPRPLGAIAVRVRPSRPADGPALAALGHPPAVAQAFCPSLARRIAWSLAGVRVVGAVAEAAGEVVGSVQLVASRRDPTTWMFGHWRVAQPRRREGIGRRLLREGIGLLPGVRRLYSFVDWGNEVSLLAHERLGFESSETAWGSATLAALSTLGAAAPAVRLEPAGPHDRAALCGLYGRATGDLWRRLFPGASGESWMEVGTGIPDAVPRMACAGLARTRIWSLVTETEIPGFVVRRGSAFTLFVDPSRCDASLLSRAALRLLDRGARRDEELSIVGLPRDRTGRTGPLAARLVLGMPDVGRLR